MLTTRPTTTLARRVWVRWLVRAAVLGVALALGVSAFAQPVTARAQYDQEFYNFCVNDLGQSVAYCCAHAGGVMRDGECGDPG